MDQRVNTVSWRVRPVSRHVKPVSNHVSIMCHSELARLAGLEALDWIGKAIAWPPGSNFERLWAGGGRIVQTRAAKLKEL